jgi:glutathione S-transferase
MDTGIAAGTLSGSVRRIVRSVPTLYRCSTPTNWLCPCGRVARALKSDGIAHEEVAVPQRRSRRPEVEALTGQRRVPVLVIDGEAICDSRRIVEYLEFRRGEGPG